MRGLRPGWLVKSTNAQEIDATAPILDLETTDWCRQHIPFYQDPARLRVSSPPKSGMELVVMTILISCGNLDISWTDMKTSLPPWPMAHCLHACMIHDGHIHVSCDRGTTPLTCYQKMIITPSQWKHTPAHPSLRETLVLVLHVATPIASQDGWRMSERAPNNGPDVICWFTQDLTPIKLSKGTSPPSSCEYSPK